MAGACGEVNGTQAISCVLYRVGGLMAAINSTDVATGEGGQ